MRLHNLFFGGGRCFFCHINFKMLLITDRQVHWCQYRGSWLTDAIEGNFVRQPNIFVWSMNSHLLALFIYLFFHFCEYCIFDCNKKLHEKHSNTHQIYKDIYVPVWLCNPFFPGVRDELPNIISFMHAWNIEIKAKVINNRLIIISVHRLELCDDISFILHT